MASNLLLDLMPGHVREELLDSGADLCVPAGQGVAQELLGGTHVFIVTKGIAAKFQRAENGRISEVGMVGAEGMFPASALLQVPAAPHIILSLTGDLIGRRIRTKDFHRIVEESAAAVLLLQKYIYAFITQISSNIVSSEQNHVTSRLARWLLMFHDRVADDDIPVTHDMLAHMTFSHRPTVTNALIAMREQGLIDASRGRIRIRSRDGLWRLCGGSYGLSERYWQQHIGPFGKDRLTENFAAA
jgi:CRP-like cAMP-binding protein